MKKIILIAVFVIASSTNMQGQFVKFGIKAGLNYANQTGTDITVDTKKLIIYNLNQITELFYGTSICCQTLNNNFKIKFAVYTFCVYLY